MTRVIAGRLRGHGILVPKTGTRPTSDRVREAIFSALESRLDLGGARVLDLFAGSGALGIEAASRGADTVHLYDSAPSAISVLRRNVAGLDAAGISATVRKARLPEVVQRPCPLPGGFDVVFADPPYDDTAAARPTLSGLIAGGWVAGDGLVVWERSTRAPAAEWPEDAEIVFERAYGETAVEMAVFPAHV